MLHRTNAHGPEVRSLDKVPTSALLRALFAAALSILCPGWGHVYAGHRLRGCLALAAIALVVLPACAVAGASLSGAAAGSVALAGAWLFWGALPLDAARRALARRPPNTFAATFAAALFFFAGSGLLGAELSWLGERFVTVFQTPTSSMLPTLVPGDVFLVDVRRAGSARPGEIAVFRPPDASAPYYAKRVVATAGSRVALEDGVLVVDGRPREWLDSTGDAEHHVEALGGARYAVHTGGGRAPRDFGPVQVPEGHVFVLGDNRGESVDSRNFGSVSVDTIRGRALRVLWSREPRHTLPRWERLGQPLGALSPLR